jgi:DNA-binding response OmpR family regulator/cellulose synthase/poly-beta-1,6-N-acetylglucosamine synthase-like glycosyltransferase
MTSISAQLTASILLVDDDEIIQKMVSVLLRRAGYDVSIASNGRDALARVSEATPDLIILDVMMPGMSGFELLRHLRSDPATKAIPIIMLTAKGTVEDIVSGLGFGADDYLSKPFEIAELVARVRARVERPPVPSENLIQDRQTGLFSDRLFSDEARREIQRANRGGAAGCLAYLRLAELDKLKEWYGVRAEAEIAKQIADLIIQQARSLGITGRDREGSFALLLPETSPETAERYLSALTGQIMKHTFKIGSSQVHLTPAIGFTSFSKGKDYESLREEALAAGDHAAAQLDLEPKRYLPAIGTRHPRPRGRFWEKVQKNWRTPFQFALTVVLGLIIPFFIYAWFDSIGHDITGVVYIVVVIALAITALLIWVEGFLALKKINPPETPAQPYPPASAIIAAYLPNEASTIVETVEVFLQLEYPAPLQVILAYTSPKELPIEAILREIAERDPRFLPVRVENSTSKAQTVNAALAEVTGEFVGIFDADHHPQPQNFTRAWRWLSSGYDVVQGHCLVRNGSDSWVAQTVAVEFEGIYSVSHPGRARLYDFGIFGGSNGYWRTELLRQTRLRGFMLTEDIDSSIRITEAGYKIVPDPQLISRELAPLTLKALWNQRMRWAQGWYQVSLRHFFEALGSSKLSLRQKLGIFWLLGWREIYPWISVQMYPLIAYWTLKFGGLDKLNWLVPIFVLTTLFTFSVGPGQTLFAYLLGAPEIKRNKRWFLYYFFRCVLFYTEIKNTIGRIAQFKEMMGERQWKITPRDRSGSTHVSGD